MDELERLAELFNRGLITEDEYESERNRIVPKPVDTSNKIMTERTSTINGPEEDLIDVIFADWPTMKLKRGTKHMGPGFAFLTPDRLSHVAEGVLHIRAATTNELAGLYRRQLRIEGILSKHFGQPIKVSFFRDSEFFVQKRKSEADAPRNNSLSSTQTKAQSYKRPKYVWVSLVAGLLISALILRSIYGSWGWLEWEWAEDQNKAAPLFILEFLIAPLLFFVAAELIARFNYRYRLGNSLGSP